MSSQKPTFYFGGQAQNPQHSMVQNHAPAPPLTNGTPVVSGQPQHMAFQQNAALPGIDLSALNGINISAEQLMQIAHLIQSGQLTLPPAAPTANPPPSALPVSNPTAATVATSPVTAQVTRATIDVDTEKEEGELEDDIGPEHASNVYARALTSTQYVQSMTDMSFPALASGVNNNPAAPAESHTIHHTPLASRFESPGGGQKGIQLAQVVEPPQSAVPDSATSDSQPSAAVKAFVLELNRVGYGFEDLAREVGDTQSLRDLYKQIGLPLPSRPSVPLTAAQQNGVDAVVPTKADAQRQTTGKPTPTAKSTAITTAKPDRASYLAKLQAAKNKKSEPVAESQTADHLQNPVVPAVISTPAPFSAVDTRAPQSATGQHPPTAQPIVAVYSQLAASTAVGSLARPPRFTVDTELVRQRLAKLQADRAAAHIVQRVSSDASKSNSTNLGLAGNVQKEKAHSDAAVPLAMPTEVRPSSVFTDRDFTQTLPPRSSAAASPSIALGFGLPGLFTTRTPGEESSSPVRFPVKAALDAKVQAEPEAATMGATTMSLADSPVPLHLPRQRPSIGQQVPRSDSGPPKRPFGESGMQNGAFIIETSSDDEDDGEDMDTDDSTDQASPEPRSIPLSAQPVGLLPDFHTSQFDPQRGTSTPGTPAGELKRKLELLEQAKQKLEEMKRRKVSVKFAASTPNASMPSPGAALRVQSSTPLPDGVTPASELGHPSPSTAAYFTKQQEKEALRKRLQELESSLGRNSTSASIAPLAKSGTVVKSAPARAVKQVSGAADGDNVDENDDEDLYELEITDPIAAEEALVPMVNVDTHASHDGDGEMYEAKAILSAEDTDMELRVSPDNGKIDLQATSHSASTNADVTDTQAMAEMTVAMADELDPKSGIANDGPEPLSSAYPGSQTSKVDQFLSKVSDRAEDGEIVDDDSEDMYEPSAAQSPHQDVVGVRIPAAEATHPADEQDDDNEAMDISSDDSDSGSSSDESSDDYEPEQNIAHMQESSDLRSSLLSASGSQAEILVDEYPEPKRFSLSDHLSPELQPEEEQHVPAVQPSPKTGFYKPYTSMLSRFKEYRYHPDFIDNVPGGHKSLTYSNNIDQEKRICPDELGGRCDKKDCDLQHFKKMTLSDNDLLREIGTRKIPAKGPEEEKKWRDGLTAVVKELRNTNSGKDVAVIAQRIAEYRRDFIGDPTKTLMLD